MMDGLGLIIEYGLIRKDSIKYLRDIYKNLLDSNRKLNKGEKGLAQIIAMKTWRALNLGIEYSEQGDKELMLNRAGALEYVNADIHNQIGLDLRLSNLGWIAEGVKYIKNEGTGTQQEDLKVFMEELKKLPCLLNLEDNFK